MSLRISAGVGGTIARVQSQTANTGASSAGTSLNIVFGSTPIAGNIIVLAIASAIMPSVTATNIQYYYHQRMAGNAVQCVLAIGRVFASASATSTVTIANAGVISIAGAEYSGGGLLRVDKTASAIGNGTSAASGATDTTSTAVELWLGALANRNSAGGAVFSSPTNSFSIVAQTNTTVGTNTDRAAALLERIVTATGTPNAGATCSSNNWSACVAALEETPGNLNSFL